MVISRVVLIFATCSCFFAAPASSQEPFGVAQLAVEELYVKPLQLSHAVLKLETETFPAGCSPDAITVRVGEIYKGRWRELLKVDTIIIDGRLQFLAASGTVLQREKTEQASIRVAASMAFIEHLNTWTAIDGSQRATKKGFIERQMFDGTSPPQYVTGTRVVVFAESSGLPILLGTPARATDKCSSNDRLRPAN